MKVALKFYGFASRSIVGKQFIGHYIKSVDIEAFNGKGMVSFTENINEALIFNNTDEALNFVRQEPKCKPLRADGKPNRPLTSANLKLVLIR